jgi:hypothetical protein
MLMKDFSVNAALVITVIKMRTLATPAKQVVLLAPATQANAALVTVHMAFANKLTIIGLTGPSRCI